MVCRQGLWLEPGTGWEHSLCLATAVKPEGLGFSGMLVGCWPESKHSGRAVHAEQDIALSVLYMQSTMPCMMELHQVHVTQRGVADLSSSKQQVQGLRTCQAFRLEHDYQVYRLL
jgi:hypothetical protein